MKEELLVKRIFPSFRVAVINLNITSKPSIHPVHTRVPGNYLSVAVVPIFPDRAICTLQ